MARTRPQLTRQTEPMLTPGQVADLFHVDPKTVTRWAKSGVLNAVMTPGGHRRYRESEVSELYRREHPEAAAVTTTTLAAVS